MRKLVRKFETHNEADRAEHEYYRSLTPEQRMDILFQLVEESSDGASEGFKRVYRIVKLDKG